MKQFVGVDIGGTDIKFGIFTETGNILEKWQVPTDIGSQGENLWSQITTEICVHTDNGRSVSGIGVGVPGPVQKDGFVEVCVNLGIRNFNPREILGRVFPDKTIAVGNDANVAALGEMWQGSGQGYENLVVITLGTGVGGGVIMDGKIVYGAKGLSGEIGHMMVNPDETELCTCGGRGCLDQMASATGIVRYTKKLLAQKYAPTVLDEKEALTAKKVFDAARAGDKLAAHSVEHCLSFLGKSLAFVSYVIDPEIFIIGGGVSHAGDYLIKIVQEYYDQYSLLKKEKARIVLATLGNDAGIYGAARMAQKEKKGKNEKV
ncbi:MAG: ROK family glucokinase [Eubacteriales bacterium]|nr:ROK family glucokinase [Eubacteriales bacterium]